MNARHPVYTEKAECQDCYKCVRHCPVKAIEVRGGSATVMAELCIACGHCVEVCPAGAKRVRDDVPAARQLLAGGARVAVSLAPSWLAEFPGLEPARLVAVLKRLGFWGVSETALGAQEVSAGVAAALRDPTPRVLVSPACPTVVELVAKYHPQLAAAVMPLCSPLLAHARLLKQLYGQELRVVFIGPCIGKKREADAHPELVNVALTFKELRRWLEAEKLDPAQEPPGDGAPFIPGPAEEGVLYPVDGGMIAGIRANCAVHAGDMMALSGVETIQGALHDLDPATLTGPLFLELLACAGGCVNGPCARTRDGTIAKRRAVLGQAAYPTAAIPRTAVVELGLEHPHPPPAPPPCTDEVKLREVLARVGKRTVTDELNCGGCGYANCREFAAALLVGKAEATMCVSHMRQLAQKKANALIKTMPSGVVIVDQELRIVECNRRFARLAGADVTTAYDAKPGLEGVALDRVAPFLADGLRHVLATGEELSNLTVRGNERVFTASLFGIEPGRSAGGVLQDVTEPAMRRDQVVRRTRDVIRRNLATVQQIAYLLGENAAESQASLNEIITAFAADPDAALTEDEEPS